MMSRMLRLLPVAVLTIGSGGNAEPQKLGVVDDQRLSEFISTLDHVVTSEDLPFRVKIFRSHQRGECSGTPESCPQVRFYISVSTFDEAPDFRVYVLPDAVDWSFERWGPAPDGDSREDHVLICLTRRIVGPSPSETWFLTEKVRVSLNPWRGTIEVVPR